MVMTWYVIACRLFKNNGGTQAQYFVTSETIKTLKDWEAYEETIVHYSDILKMVEKKTLYTYNEFKAQKKDNDIPSATTILLNFNEVVGAAVETFKIAPRVKVEASAKTAKKDGDAVNASAAAPANKN